MGAGMMVTTTTVTHACDVCEKAGEADVIRIKLAAKVTLHRDWWPHEEDDGPEWPKGIKGDFDEDAKGNRQVFDMTAEVCSSGCAHTWAFGIELMQKPMLAKKQTARKVVA